MERLSRIRIGPLFRNGLTEAVSTQTTMHLEKESLAAMLLSTYEPRRPRAMGNLPSLI